MAEIYEFPVDSFDKNITDDFIRQEYDRQQKQWDKLARKLHCLDPRNQAYFNAICLQKKGVVRQ